ncbi:MAG TPA: tRNA (guanosine(37)-N1)-methyltransferase TrmD [Thermoanaerobaculia bacterium]|nr:tRNA (guanosine(37)-N1)-methyltransferase TrmD [Thermoanaerobaculia bacterium]
MITIFPELFEPFRRTSLVGRAVEAGLLSIAVHDLRSWSADPHRSVDDEPYGGGGGMVMTAPPWIAAVGAVSAGAQPWRILLSPQGAALTDAKVRELARRPHLLFLCGRYEGIDERVAQTVVDDEISIGDYVLAGGELAAMVVVEAVSRWIPGVVGLPDSVESDSFGHGLLDHPHYTRPREVAGLAVPEVLLSGDHRAIREWRREQAVRRTRERRPDLLRDPESCKRAGEEG